MVFTDHQVRQFYVVDSTHTATPVVSNHKFYVKYIDPACVGTSPQKYITTDKIDSNCIRDIRITKQSGFIPKVWVITPGTSNSTVSNVYLLRMMFRNVFGGGVNDFYVKDIPVVIPANTSTSDVLSKIKSAIEDDFSRDFVNPFNVTTTTTSIVLVEKTPEYNATSMIRGMHRTHLDININVDEANMTGTNSAPVMSNWGTITTFTINDIPTFSSTKAYAVGDYVQYGSGSSAKIYVFKAAHAAGAWSSSDVNEVVLVSSVTASVNGPEVCDMEYFFSKGRADLFGYMGFPDINPSEMVASAASDYYILDIKYFYQEAGVNNQNSEKELSFACTDKSTLETVITNIVDSTTGTTLSGGRECEIYAPKAY